MTNVIDFPMKCVCCNCLIDAGDVYYSDPNLGFICERCPEFSRGGVHLEELFQ